MILLPYYITEKTLPIGCKVWTLWICMAASGKELWKTDETDPSEIINEYFTENGIFGTHQPSDPPFLVYKIDRDTTRLADFHTWADVLSKKTPEHVWRPFYWIGEKQGAVDSWGWKEELTSVKLDPLHTIGEIWEIISRTETTV